MNNQSTNPLKEDNLQRLTHLMQCLLLPAFKKEFYPPIGIPTELLQGKI